MLTSSEVNHSGSGLLCGFGPLKKAVRTSRGRTAYSTTVAEAQVRPTWRRRCAAGPQPARNRSRGNVKGSFALSFSPDAFKYPLFLGAGRAGTPLRFFNDTYSFSLGSLCPPSRVLLFLKSLSTKLQSAGIWVRFGSETRAF